MQKIKPLNLDYTIPSYNPSRLLNHLICVGSLRNDAGLARKLLVSPAVISKVRSRTLGLSEALILRIYDEMQIDPVVCRNLAGLMIGTYVPAEV